MDEARLQVLGRKGRRGLVDLQRPGTSAKVESNDLPPPCNVFAVHY